MKSETENPWTAANIAMVVFLVVFFILALVGVVAGVLLHKEPGFIPDVPRWSAADLPLEVAAAGTVEAWQVDALTSAVEATNDQVGFRLLELGSGASAQVLVAFGVPAEPGWRDPGGDSRIEHVEGRALRCRVDIVNVGQLEILYLVLQHELGHCLGLAHDDFESSIMREEQTGTPDGQFPPRLTDYDRGLLRELYAP